MEISEMSLRSKKGENKTSKIDIASCVTPLKELPESIRTRYSPIYDGIMDYSMNHESENIFKIEIPDRNYKTITSGLNSRIRKRKLPFVIKHRNKIVYLVKTW